MEKEKTIRPIEFFADVEFPYEEQLNDLESRLSQEEESILKDIIESESQIEKKDFMNDLLVAVKKGAEDYLDAMTDTGDTFDKMKRSADVSKWDNALIERKQKPATIEENERMSPRTMAEAADTPFDNDSAHSSEGMSDQGASKFAKHLEAYQQRTKSVTDLSSEGHTIHYKTDIKANRESLSSLRGYRIGIVVPMDSASEVQEAYQREIKTNGVIDNKAKWIRTRNFDKFDDALVKEYGFKSKAEAKKWREANHLTIHESADGMILVPTDVHDKVSHSGYCSQMEKLLKGEITKEQFEKSVVQEKIAYVKHEATQHGIRVAKGIGIDVVKEMLRFSIATVCRETYNEFHQSSEDKFVQRAMRILENCWQKLKAKFKHFFKSLLDRGVKSILNELLVMLNDYFLGVFKKIFKIVRQMWGSIKSAFKIICNKTSSWEERIFEATKILSAGVVGILGFSLNDLIEKMLMSIGMPFASFIAECLSGLFAGIMSAVVLMLFDNLKATYKTQNNELQILQKQSTLVNVYTLQIGVDSLKTDLNMLSAYKFFDLTFEQIMCTRERIKANHREGYILQKELSEITKDANLRTTKLSTILNQIDNEDF